jgi:hypothetical protein
LDKRLKRRNTDIRFWTWNVSLYRPGGLLRDDWDGAKSITIVRAVTADFFFDCRAAEVPSDE